MQGTLSTVRGVEVSAKTSISDNNDNEGSKAPSTIDTSFHNMDSIVKTKYRRLGNTDMMVSNLGLGTASFGDIYGRIADNPVNIVKTALLNGINIIDVGYWYGQKRSEEVLGQALKGIPRKVYYLCIRVGRFELDYARPFDYRADRILTALTKSLSRLNQKYADVCFLQVTNNGQESNINTILEETLPALRIAQDNKKIRYIGIAGYNLHKLKEVIQRTNIRIDVCMTYCKATLMDNTLAEHIKFFTERNIGIVNAGCFSMGMLTEKGPPLWHPSDSASRETAREAVEYCKSKGIRIEKLALAYALRFWGVTTCMVSIEDFTQLAINLATAWAEATLPTKEMRVLDRIKRRYLDKIKQCQWDVINMRTYWRHLESMGLPMLSTDRVSSMESLASTYAASIVSSCSKCNTFRRHSKGSH